jgi:hypothetical protein
MTKVLKELKYEYIQRPSSLTVSLYLGNVQSQVVIDWKGGWNIHPSPSRRIALPQFAQDFTRSISKRWWAGETRSLKQDYH